MAKVVDLTPSDAGTGIPTRIDDDNEFNLLNSRKIEAKKDEIPTICQEVGIIFNIAIRIGFSVLFELGPIFMATIFMGHLPDPQSVLSGTGLARTFSNVTGTGLAWGFTSGLWQLIPKAMNESSRIGLRTYIQRAFYVTSMIMIFATIIQFFGGDIMCFIGSGANPPLCDSVDKNIITNYCRILIPYIWGMTWLTIMQRVGQSLQLNTELLYVVFVPFCLAIPLNWLLLFYFNIGYIGTGIVINISIFLSCILCIILLCYKGYYDIFIPLPLSLTLFNYNGLFEYFKLSYPGCFQIGLSWFVRELMTILSAYIVNPKLAISVTVVSSSLNILFVLGEGICNGLTLRVGKYIQNNNEYLAKRVIKISFLMEFIFLVVLVTLFLYFRYNIARLWTYDEEIINLVSNIIFIVVIRQTTIGIYMNISGIYRGLGFQKIGSWTMATCNYLIAMPINIVLLFALKFKDNIKLGLYTIWGTCSFGYILGTLMILFILIFYIKWENALNKVRNEKKQTIKDYGTLTKQLTKNRLNNKYNNIDIDIDNDTDTDNINTNNDDITDDDNSNNNTASIQQITSESTNKNI